MVERQKGKSRREEVGRNRVAYERSLAARPTQPAAAPPAPRPRRHGGLTPFAWSRAGLGFLLLAFYGGLLRAHALAAPVWSGVLMGVGLAGFGVGWIAGVGSGLLHWHARGAWAAFLVSTVSLTAFLCGWVLPG